MSTATEIFNNAELLLPVYTILKNSSTSNANNRQALISADIFETTSNIHRFENLMGRNTKPDFFPISYAGKKP